MRNNLTKIFAVMAMSVMTVAAMATAVSIPTTGGYVAWSDAVLENCNTCNDGKGIENTSTSTKATFTLNNATEQAYYISMRTTANNVTAVFSVTVKNGDDVLFTTNRNVENTNGWFLDHYSVTPTQHNFCIGTLPIGTLTLEIAGVSSSASSIGNYGFMTILSASEYDNIPGSITLANGVYKGPKLENSNTNVGYVQNEGTAQYTFISNTAGVYKMTMDVARYNIGGTMNIKVVDGQSGAAEVNYDYTIASDAPGSYTSTDILLPADITTGIKTMTFTFSNGSSYICNYKTPTFTKMYDHMAKVSGVSITGQTVTAGATSDWYCALPVSYDENTTIGVSASNGTVVVTAKDGNDADVAVTNNGDGTYTISTPDLNATTTVSVALTANSGCLAEKATYTFKIYRIGEISLTAVTVDGVAVDVLTDINNSVTSYTATVTNCYTTAPTVAAVQVDEANATVDDPTIDGSTYTYTIHGSMAGGTITRDYTLVLNNVHVYAPTGDEERANVKNGEGTLENNVWSNGVYTLSGSLDGGSNGQFKLNGQNYTITLPADVVVKQLIIKSFANNYTNNTGDHLVSVTSTGATAYIPIVNNCWHSTEGAAYDLIVTIDGHTAGTPIAVSFSQRTGQPLGWFQLTVVHQDPGTAPVKTADEVVYDDNDAVVAVTFDRVIANDVTATIGGNSVKAKGGSTTLYFPVWDLAYSSSNTLTIATGAATDNYGHSTAADIEVAVNIPAKTAVAMATYDYVVSNTEEFLAAIEAVRATNENNANAARKTIFLKNGDYNLGSSAETVLWVRAHNLSLIGESRDGVVIRGTSTGISNPVLNLRHWQGYYLQDLTVRNDFDYGTGSFNGVSVAIYGGDKTIMKNVRMLSNQDTQVTGHRVYHEDCEIHGTVDFICGGGDNYYYHTDLVLEDRGGNCITAPSTSSAHKWGYVFDHCTIKAVEGATAAVDGSFSLGRPWQNEPRATYLHTTMNVLCSDGGWASMGSLPTHFYEYDSRDGNNAAIDLSSRTVSGISANNYTPVLTAEQAAEFTVHNVLGGTDAWDAAALAAQVSAPVNVAAHGYELTWNAVEDALLYAVFKDGAYVANVTTTSYTASETGSYTIKAANRFGGLSVASAAVEVTGAKYERAFAHMQLNTLCFPYQIDSYTGATFYTLTYKVMSGEEVQEVILDEHEGALVAGHPYFYIPEAGYDKLVCNYSGSDVEALTIDGVVGSYNDNADVPADSYVTYNGQIRKAGTGVTLGEYRAYIDMSLVSATPTPAMAGRRRLSIRNADAPAGTTDFENVSATFGGSQKILRNGQLFIIRDGKTYNAQGQLVK